MVSPDSVMVPRVPAYLGCFQASNRFRLRGYHPLCRNFPVPSAIDSACHIEVPQDVYKRQVVLGLVVGVISTLFIVALCKTSKWFDSLSGNYYIRHAFGMVRCV